MENNLTYRIDISEITESHESVIKSCSKLVDYFLNNPNSRLILDFTNADFIYPDYSILILCAIKHIENSGVKVSGRIRYNKNSSVLPYLARMNFFEYLNVQIPQEIRRLPSNNFVEIKNYNEENQIEVLHSLMNVIRINSLIDDNVYAGLDYCLNEVLDNVLNHSEMGNGWVVAQYFGSMNSIRIIVADNGIGIHESLNKAHEYTVNDSIRQCIVEGVTNGLGQGHGLYATATFAKLNKGWLSLISGEKKMDVSASYTKVSDISFWQGTCVYLRVNTNVKVDYKVFTSKNYDYKQQLFEDMFE